MGEQHQFVGYVRISDERDEDLWRETQTADLNRYVGQVAGELIGCYEDTESATTRRLDYRPGLDQAIAHCKRTGATLLVAKFDRLIRSVKFLVRIMDQKIDMLACDNPHVNKLTLYILAAVAEDEADRISARTKAALKTLKEKGVKLGNHREGHWDGFCRCPKCKNKENLRTGCPACGGTGLTNKTKMQAIAEGRRLGARVAGFSHIRRAKRAYEKTSPVILHLRKKGLTLKCIALELNKEPSCRTQSGHLWTAAAVHRVLKRESLTTGVPA
jgi:hypothetical protein